jgi:hypothetical protein
VIFRRWYRKTIDGEGIIALFPDERSEIRSGFCMMYEHVGQHGEGDLAGVISRTRPVTDEAEYASLMRELESPPYTYNLRVIQRSPH